MLQARDLTKVYTENKTVGLTGFSCNFGDRGLVFLLGRSGSGKTTLLNLIGGLDTPTGGEFFVDGRSSASFTPAELDDYRNAHIGFVFQEYRLIPEYTVGQNVALALELLGEDASESRSKVDAVLRRVGLVEKDGSTMYSRPAGDLSGGQKQRVAIARALVKDPKILLADEPTGALDSLTGHELYVLLKGLSKERLVIVVTHDGVSAKKFGDRILTLSDGKLISDTAPPVPAPDGSAQTCVLKKSSLRPARILRMGASGLKVKPFRLVLSVLLSFIAFFSFGFALTMAAADPYRAEIATLYSEGKHMIFVEGYGKDPSAFTEEQVSIIDRLAKNRLTVSEFALVDPVTERQTEWFSYLLGEGGASLMNTSTADPYHYVGGFQMTRAVELDPDLPLEDFHLKPDPRFSDPSLCRVPTSPDEIAITDIRADMILEFGLVGNGGTELAAFSSVDELIGADLGGYKIVGVYQTEVDKSYFEAHKGVVCFDLDPNDPVLLYTEGAARDSMISFAYVCKNFHTMKNVREAGTFFRADDRVDIVASALRKIDPNREGTDDMFAIGVHTAVSEFVPFGTVVGNIALIGLFAGIVLGAFGILLTVNFMNISVQFKRREIGILRALGMRKREIGLICLAEGGIVAAIEFVLSFASLYVACAIANAVFHITMFMPSFWCAPLLFLLCFGANGLSIWIPARAIVRKTPVEILKNE